VILEKAANRAAGSRWSRRVLTLVIAGSEAPAPGAARKVNEWSDNKGEVCARAYTSKGLHWIDWPGLGVFAFSPGSHEVRVWLEPSSQHEAIVDTFSRTLEPVILQTLGWQAIHAGAAVGPAGVVAFCGKKGSGKSTLAFAMHQAGWRQFADDALVLRFDQDRVMSCPLPFTPRLTPASCAHFAHALSPSLSSPDPADAPLTAVFLLHQNPDLTSLRISLMPQARAFSELLAHAHCFDAEDATETRRLVDDYLGLVARVPVFALEYRPDLQQLPHLTRAVMEATTGLNANGAFSSKLQPVVLQS
jgi:hypothetical protein